MSAGRNEPCPCGSGRKYKQCCMGRDQAAEQVQHRFGFAPATSVRAGPSGVWQVDLTPMMVRIDSEADVRPAAALVVEDGMVLIVDLVEAPPSATAAIAAELHRIVSDAAGRTGAWPRRVEVRDADVARHLSELLALRQVEVTHHRRLDSLDDAAADLLEHVAGRAPDMPPVASPETWRGWGLPEPVIAELFRAAAAFWRRAPWRWIAGELPLFAEAGTSRRWTCSVLGQGGQEFGLALHAEESDFVRILEEGSPPVQLAGPILSLTFDRAADLPPRMRREVTAAGWEVAGRDAYPVLFVLGMTGGALTRAHADDLIRLLHAIPEFVELYRDSFDFLEPPEDALEWTAPESGVRLRYHGGPADALDWIEWDEPGGELWEPVDELAPALPEGPSADPEAVFGLIADDPEEIDSLAGREQAVVERFASALRGEGLSEATVRKHAVNAGTFVELLASYLGVPVRAVTEYDLRSFLFDLYPRKVRDTAERTEAMPVSLARFFNFLAAQEGIVCPWADAVLAERDQYRARTASFPGGFWWDEEVAEWRGALEQDLVDRMLVHWPVHADDTPWGLEMGPVEAGLQREVQRRWLFWRDEAIRGGLTDPDAVAKIAIERQLAWERAPHPRLGGRSPIDAVQEERKGRAPESRPGPLG